MKRDNICILLYLTFAIIVFFTFALPSLNKEISFQLFWDALTYYKLYDDNVEELFGISFNYLGPFVILYLTQENFYFIFILNCSLFVFSYKLIVSSLNINRGLFLFFVMISSQTLFALFSVNKEILSFFTLALLVRNLVKFNIFTFCLLLLFALMTRWQLLLFVVVLYVLLYIDLYYRRRLFMLLCLLIGISVIFPLSDAFLHPISYGLIDLGRFSLYQWFVDKGSQIPLAYVVIFLPKLFHILFAPLVLYYDLILHPVNFFNNVVQPMFSAAILILVVTALWMKKLFRLSILHYALFIYCILFTITPVGGGPRYYYFAYLLLAVIVACKGEIQHPQLKKVCL